VRGLRLGLDGGASVFEECLIGPVEDTIDEAPEDDGLFGPLLAWTVCRVQSAPALTQLEQGIPESQRRFRSLHRSQDCVCLLRWAGRPLVNVMLSEVSI
jgi:hypothetical protein